MSEAKTSPFINFMALVHEFDNDVNRTISPFLILFGDIYPQLPAVLLRFAIGNLKSNTFTDRLQVIIGVGRFMAKNDEHMF